MSEYIKTPTTEKGGNATGDDALDNNQSGLDTPVMEGGTTVPFPNSDAAPSVSAGPIGVHITQLLEDHGLEKYPAKHTCGERGCLKVFATGSKLRGHANSTQHKSHRCKCGFADTSKWCLDIHIKTAKPAVAKNIGHVQVSFEKAHTCAENGCRQVFLNGSKLEEHARVKCHKAFQCVCNKGFSKLYSLQRHVDESRNDGGRKYKCPLKSTWRDPKWGCYFSCKRLNHLEQHIRGVCGHKKTAKEAQAILLPFRKRKPGPPKSSLTISADATADDLDDNPLGSPQGNSTTPESSTSNKGSPQVAFLAVSTGAVSAQNAHAMMPTAGPAGPALGSANSPELPGDLPATLLGDGELLPTTNASSFQVPNWLEDLDMHAGQASGLPGSLINGHYSQSAYGSHLAPLMGACPNNYASVAPNDLFTGTTNSATWAAPFGEGPVSGYGTQYSMPPMAPSFGTFIDQSGASKVYYPPMNPALRQSASLGHGCMSGFPPYAFQMSMPMGQMHGYHGTFQSNIGSSGLTSTHLHPGAWPQNLDSFIGESLDGSFTAAPQTQTFPGLADESNLKVFDFVEDMGSYNV